MSVIFGIVEQNRIIISGDARTSSLEGDIVSDETYKVFVLNKKLVIATAGNVATQKAILSDLEKQCDKNILTTDDVVMIIENFYKKVVANKCTSILELSFYCLIAGIGKDGMSHLINAGKFQGVFGAGEVSAALYPPEDMKQNDCNEIFAKNHHLYHSDFCERTIREIADSSKYVSSNGSKWIYDFSNEKGLLSKF